MAFERNFRHDHVFAVTDTWRATRLMLQWVADNLPDAEITFDHEWVLKAESPVTTTVSIVKKSDAARFDRFWAGPGEFFMGAQPVV